MRNAGTVLDVLREGSAVLFAANLHGVIAGEPRGGKLARGVRTGGRWKRTRLRRAPRQRPTGVTAHVPLTLNRQRRSPTGNVRYRTYSARHDRTTPPL
jgi:hypothetical protein